MMAGILDADIEHRTLVRADPEGVYDALATAEGLDAWFTTGATVNARAGGYITFRWVDAAIREARTHGAKALEARTL